MTAVVGTRDFLGTRWVRGDPKCSEMKIAISALTSIRQKWGEVTVSERQCLPLYQAWYDELQGLQLI